MADQSPEPTPPHREVVDFTQSAPAAIVTTNAADETRPRGGSTSDSIPAVVVQDFDEGAALRRARSNSRKKKKKHKQKAHKHSTTETETGSESDTEDEAEESSSSSSSSESDDEEEEKQDEKKAPPKKTRFDVPKKAKKDKSAFAPRSSVDVAALRYALLP